MRDLLKYGLFAAAGYYAWNHLIPSLTPQPPAAGPGASDPLSPAPPPAAQPGPTAPAPSPAPANQAPAASGLRLAILTEAAKQGYSALSRLSYDQWNWFAEQVIGTPGPAWEDVNTGQPRSQALTIDAYLAAVAPTGLSGLGCLAGLGCGSCQGCAGAAPAAPAFVRRGAWA